MPDKSGLSQAYLQSYEATDPKKIGAFEPGSEQEKQAIKRFSDFFAVLTEDKVRQQVRNVYAKEFYFNDTLKEIRDIDTLERYLIHTAQKVESCTVDLLDVSVNHGEYYFRWLMHIKFKEFKKGQIQTSNGMTHIRFNKEGKIIFHQDYWDAASHLFEKVPFVGWMIRKIKKRL